MVAQIVQEGVGDVIFLPCFSFSGFRNLGRILMRVIDRGRVRFFNFFGVVVRYDYFLGTLVAGDYVLFSSIRIFVQKFDVARAEFGPPMYFTPKILRGVRRPDTLLLKIMISGKQRFQAASDHCIWPS